MLGLAALLTLAVAFFLLRAPAQSRQKRPVVARQAPSSSPAIFASPPLSESRVSSSGHAATAQGGAWLAALVDAIARGQARELEAVLMFKDDDALARFLQRAPANGMTVLNHVAALRSVRVRLDSVAAFNDELDRHGQEYADVSANNLFAIPSSPPKEDRAAVDHVPFGNDALAFLGATGDRRTWGLGTTLAILDTGMGADATFGAGRVRSIDVGYGVTPGTGRADGHGTAVGALAAGASPDAPGVAPGADIVSIRVTDQLGTSDLFTLSRGIVAAVDAGARIINISLGGYATGPMLDAAIGYAARNGAVIVAAAGNDQAAQLAWPAAHPQVVSVGAVDHAEQRVSFSNSSPQLSLTAPGYGVQTAWLGGQRVHVDGTSASAPLVAGSIAAVLSQNPGLTAVQAADLLAQTANDAGTPGADSSFGRGIVNLASALNSGKATYVDTAVSSHSYDADTNQMLFVVQNRSGRAVSGMALAVTAGAATAHYTVPSLAAGATYVARVPVNDTLLKTAGRIPFSTQLTNPTGVVDQVPANNRRTSVLSAPIK